MFRFFRTEYFVLVIISIIFSIYLIRSFIAYRDKILSIFREDLLKSITKNFDFRRVFIYILLCAIALIVLSIGIMSPQFGRRSIDIKKRGIDIIIALDVSRSMLAKDILPSRLERAKAELSNLLSMLKGDRVGVILFAGQAFMQVPLTTDYDAAKLFLRGVGVDSVPVQGTNFRAAFELARDTFLNNQQTGGAKVLLMLTDGEDHEGNYDSIIDEFRSYGIRVYAIGLGSITGEPVPEEKEDGRSYKRDKNGQIVISRLNEGVLKRITSSTGGVYIQGSNKEMGMPVIAEELRALKKGEISTKEVYDYLDRYYIFALLSFGILLYAFLILPFTGKRDGIKITLVIFLLSPLLSGFSPFLRENPDVKAGNESYSKGNYKEAYDNYMKALRSLEREPLIHYNSALALIKEQRYNEAYDELRKALVGADDKLKSKIYYNMGNLFLYQQKYDEAIDFYIKSIRADREFLDPKHNLEMVLRMMKEQQKDNQKEEKDKNEDNKKDEKKDEKEKQAENKEEEKNEKGGDERPQNQDAQRDLVKAEQLLNSLKDKEMDQPFNKFLIKEFKSTDVEKDW